MGSGRVYLSDSFLGCVRGRESDEGIPAVQIRQRVHHEPQVPNRSAFLKQRNQLVLVNVSRNFPAKHLQKKNEEMKSI